MYVCIYKNVYTYMCMYNSVNYILLCHIMILRLIIRNVVMYVCLCVCMCCMQD